MKTVADLWPGDRVLVDKSDLVGLDPYLTTGSVYEVKVVNIDISGYDPRFAELTLVDGRDDQFILTVLWSDTLK